jgi:two-component system response regulator PilR (NtrC family)
MATILIVDDELSMREFLQILLEKEGYKTLTAANGSEAVKLIQANNIELVISDIRMPEMTGLDLLKEVKKKDYFIPVIMITAYASPEDAVLAMKGGAYDYITKPFKVDEIKNIIKTALNSGEGQNNQEESIAGFSGIIGNSMEMLKIFDLIKRIAPTHANVLIYGESGTGKELVAQAIHKNSKVANSHFVPISCNAIPETLFESELFGHIKGSFTGATSNKIGLFEVANNGTAFLDEIGELTPTVQTKLLRVLQERELKKVGDTKTKKIDVRIISATNRDLEDEITAKNFREDLYYRLAVVPIRMPPLRDRKDDIPLLTNHFLQKYARIFNNQRQRLSNEAMEILQQYDFPGNVRELENIIERGVALSSTEIILPESLSLPTQQRSRKNYQTSSFATDIDSEEELFSEGLETVMTNFEKKLIKIALKKADHSKMRAAELLKISFRSLRYKIQKYHIS